jgi:O-acetyl-ADP-ribose deacetylase (regulator of RNase III)
MNNITLTSGDLFESEMQTLVNATNTEGVMGGGIALAFRERFPDMYRNYRRTCLEGLHTVDEPHLWNLDQDGPWILNLATKDLVRNDSTIPNIQAGLRWVVRHYEEEGITSIAFPALGCGLGGLSWKEVKPVMIYFLSRLDIPVEIYEPHVLKVTVEPVVRT